MFKGETEKDGAGEGTRTPDPIITNDVLYQLSYCGAGGVCLTKGTPKGKRPGSDQ